jgi:hypothetical protein
VTKKAAIKFWCKLVGQPAAGVCCQELVAGWSEAEEAEEEEEEEEEAFFVLIWRRRFWVWVLHFSHDFESSFMMSSCRPTCSHYV